MQKERQYPRKKITRDIMCFTEYASEGGAGRSYFFATLVDVSKNGAGLKIEQSCAPDDEIWLHGLDAASESISGKVVWTQKAGDSYSLGLHFSAH
ncbi:PilZ domain-containing protein [Pseudomonadota bacterium]